MPIIREIKSFVMLDHDHVIVTLRCGHQYKIKRTAFRNRSNQFMACPQCEKPAPPPKEGGAA